MWEEIAMKTLKGRKVKQINTLSIHYCDAKGYTVWTKNGVCLMATSSFDDAEDFCRNYRLR